MKFASRNNLLSILFIIILCAGLSVTVLPERQSAAGNYSASYLGIQEYSAPLEAREFALKDVSSKKVNLKDFRGKVIMLNFWATWCGPCRDEMPSMEKLYRQFKDRGFVIIAVASGEDVTSVNTFFKQYNLTFTALIDSDYKVSDNYKVWALPTTYFINSSGQIIGKAQGGRDWSTRQASQYIAALLQTAP
ncbi:MAG: TlpA family protein disulfide reductase [Nitrospirae bacterium]|nr:TlpA family protein disulfide reductase [Nitrospirota bacterium]